MADENFTAITDSQNPLSCEKPVNPPRFREKRYKNKDGGVYTYYVWDGRTSQRGDVRLGKDRDEALKRYEQVEKFGIVSFSEGADGQLILKTIRAPNRVIRSRKSIDKSKRASIRRRKLPEDDWSKAPAWLRTMYKSADTRSAKKAREFTLTPCEFLEIAQRANGKCEVSSIPFTEPSNRHPFSPSIDRIDSSKGYTKDNVRLVCLVANIAMSSWGIGPVLALAKAINAPTI